LSFKGFQFLPNFHEGVLGCIICIIMVLQQISNMVINPFSIPIHDFIKCRHTLILVNKKFHQLLIGESI